MDTAIKTTKNSSLSICRQKKVDALTRLKQTYENEELKNPFSSPAYLAFQEETKQKRLGFGEPTSAKEFKASIDALREKHNETTEAQHHIAHPSVTIGK